MSLLRRLSWILGLALLALVAALWLAKRESDAAVERLRTAQREQRADAFTRAIQLQGKGLETLVSSYSWWQEMVQFVANPDPKWASNNCDNMVGSPNGGDAIWVLTTDFQLLHSINADYGKPPLPFQDSAVLKKHIGKLYQFGFFARIDNQVWQIFGAAIQDPNFWRHETPVVGYLLLGKRWDDAWLAVLAATSQAPLRIVPGDRWPEAGSREFVQALRGLGDEPVAAIVGTVNTGAVDDVQQELRSQFLTTILGVAVFLAVAAVLLSTLVLQPIDQIQRSLESRNPQPIAELLHTRTPLGHIARLLATQFRQGRMLQDEIRRHLETSRQAADEDPESLRLRLASDLHDGPLQSLYAAGLKISVLQSRINAGQVASAADLESVRAILGECTVNLRSLLFDLEPEGLRDHELETALERLERYVNSLGTRFHLQIEEHALDGLSRQPQLHLFYICRELASNAARHARPKDAHLSFERQPGFLRVEWSNDGVLAPMEPVKVGNGLRNIDQRVKALDGTWQYQLDEDGWRVMIELPYTSLITPLVLTDTAESP